MIHKNQGSAYTLDLRLQFLLQQKQEMQNIKLLLIMLIKH